MLTQRRFARRISLIHTRLTLWIIAILAGGLLFFVLTTFLIAHGLLISVTQERLQQNVISLTDVLQRRAKRLNHINSSFLAWEEDTRNAETSPAHPEW